VRPLLCTGSYSCNTPPHSREFSLVKIAFVLCAQSPELKSARICSPISRVQLLMFNCSCGRVCARLYCTIVCEGCAQAANQSNCCKGNLTSRVTHVVRFVLHRLLVVCSRRHHPLDFYAGQVFQSSLSSSSSHSSSSSIAMSSAQAECV
jgi:hypothetical protein